MMVFPTAPGGRGISAKLGFDILSSKFPHAGCALPSTVHTINVFHVFHVVFYSFDVV